MSVDALREAIERKDSACYTALLAEDVRFFTPVESEPVVGREAVGRLLGAVFDVFQDFRYVGQASGDGLHVLVFQARVGAVRAEGIDLLRIDDEGLIREFTVMMRPLAAVQAMSREMATRFGPPDQSSGSGRAT